MDTFTTSPVEQNSSKVWWIVAIVFILVITAFAIYYMRGGDMSSITGLTQSNDVSKLQQQGTSDNTAAIEADLKATDLSNLNTESSLIDKELSAPATK